MSASKYYMVQEWNPVSKWYDLPDMNPTKSFSVAERIFKQCSRPTAMTRVGIVEYKYRIVSRVETIIKEQ